MGNLVARKLIFRLGAVGFSLDLAYVVEICERVGDLLDSSYSDLNAGIVGALDFRNTRVPAIDPALGFDLISTVPLSGRTALILNSPEGNWALLVDRVAEIRPIDRFLPIDMPPLLREGVSNYYSQVEWYNNEPLVRFDPERFYGTPGSTS